LKFNQKFICIINIAIRDHDCLNVNFSLLHVTGFVLVRVLLKKKS